MSRRVGWLKPLAILVVAIITAGLIATLAVRPLQVPRAARERAAAGERVQREFHGPQLRGAPAVLKQIVIIGVIALLGRTVLRIRL